MYFFLERQRVGLLGDERQRFPNLHTCKEATGDRGSPIARLIMLAVDASCCDVIQQLTCAHASCKSPARCASSAKLYRGSNAAVHARDAERNVADACTTRWFVKIVMYNMICLNVLCICRPHLLHLPSSHLQHRQVVQCLCVCGIERCCQAPALLSPGKVTNTDCHLKNEQGGWQCASFA